ncbi:MAG: hypothetical protein HOY79_43935 [Streptomyces sp.]|nr:hypothetical protein [Streptomyces sp.]
MSYFNLGKREPEPELEPDELEENEQPEETEDEAAADVPSRDHGPILTGLLGPGQWLTARFNLDTAIIVHIAAVFSISYYGGWIAAGVLLAWLIAVLLFIPRDTLERWAAGIEGLSRSEKAADAAAVEPLKAGPEDVRAATLEWIHRQIGDTQGVHLRDLLQHAQQHGMFEGLDVTTFRSHLERWGIPVRRRVRVRGKGITVGIHRDDLKAPPQAPSPTPSQDTQESGLHPA